MFGAAESCGRATAEGSPSSITEPGGDVMQKLIGVFLGLLCFLPSFAYAQEQWPPNPGSPYPDLRLIDESGKPFQLSTLKGKVLVVKFGAMACPATQALSGAHTAGGFAGINPQPGLSSFDQMFERYTHGLNLTADSDDIAFVHILFYDATGNRAPTAKELARWNKHFSNDKSNHITVAAPAELTRRTPRASIPGFQLVDQKFILRSDATGANQRLLYSELLPSVGPLLAQRSPTETADASPGRRQSFEQYKQSITPKLTTLIDSKDFAGLEELFAKTRAAKNRLTDYGSELHYLYQFVSKGTKAVPRGEPEQYLQFLNAWRQAYPKSVAERVTRASFLNGQAWKARGTGYAKSVSEHGMKTFRENVKQAMVELLSCLECPERDPYYYSSIISIGGAAGLPKEQIISFSEAALALDNRCVSAPLAATMLLLPRWGGAPNDVVRFAEHVATLAGEEYGDIHYATIAHTVLGIERENIHTTQSDFSWPRIRRGFEKLDQLFGNDESNWNRFAQIAYSYQDREAAQMAFSHIDRGWNSTRSGIWHSRENLELARRWAVEGQKAKGKSELFEAIIGGRIEKIQSLLTAGANVNQMNERGQSPLLLALSNHRVSVAQLLIKHGADIQIRDRKNRTVLQQAARIGDEALISTLLKKGLKVSAQDRVGRTSVHEAASRGFQQVLELLLKAEPEAASIASRSGKTALHLAAATGHVGTMKILLASAGTDVNVQDQSFRTPLIRAASYGSPEAVQILLDAGADTSIRDASGQTAKDHATKQKHGEVVKLLTAKP